MDEASKLILLAELTDERCELNHGPGTDKEVFPATDFIVIPIGFIDNKTETDTCTREMVIPVCQECAEALLGEEWTLLYCLECCASQWVCRQLAKKRYRHHILWMKGCPHCGGFGGLYFNDSLKEVLG